MRSRLPQALAASVATSLLLSTPAAAAPPTATKTHVIVMDKMKFGPAPASLRVGDVIVWINRDLFRHTATAANKSFDVDLPPGTQKRMTVRTSGLIPYTCKFHPGMRGVLKVAAR
jgi:plastocyanin